MVTPKHEEIPDMKLIEIIIQFLNLLRELFPEEGNVSVLTVDQLTDQRVTELAERYSSLAALYERDAVSASLRERPFRKLVEFLVEHADDIQAIIELLTGLLKMASSR
jgi:hypothetical protein